MAFLDSSLHDLFVEFKALAHYGVFSENRDRSECVGLDLMDHLERILGHEGDTKARQSTLLALLQDLDGDVFRFDLQNLLSIYRLVLVEISHAVNLQKFEFEDDLEV